eukprot:CAMPEP_0202710602 /NCGR_PEP_ID=MMETSP1385-20130828/22562_1 /ASSEMBLY_ACC=CAM_ASM_000861 /TAXON_ID=933848 /ORGANISM="Elphidium margaritaceum" /LENGTH=41 /DNA_ID= /DNA_START= /DNA_END= /DNA_ORIENTATION=
MKYTQQMVPITAMMVKIQKYAQNEVSKPKPTKEPKEITKPA